MTFLSNVPKMSGTPPQQVLAVVDSSHIHREADRDNDRSDPAGVFVGE